MRRCIGAIIPRLERARALIVRAAVETGVLRERGVQETVVAAIEIRAEKFPIVVLGEILRHLVPFGEITDFAIHRAPPRIGFGRVNEIAHEDGLATVHESNFPPIASCLHIAAGSKLPVAVVLSLSHLTFSY